MNNKKLLQQVLKIDQKADIVHTHEEYLELSDLPNGGYMSIDIKAKEWSLGENGLYTTVVRHQLGTNKIIVEAVSAEGSLLVIGYDAKGENIVELSSEEAIDMTVSIIHRADAHTAVGYNPINDDEINNFQTWSSAKVNKTITEITGAIDMSMLATKEEVEEDLAANLKASKDYTDQAIRALPEADVTKAYVDAQLENKMDKNGSATEDITVKNITVNGAIIPGSTGLTIGTEENRFEGIYVDEAYLSTNTLYIGDTPILGTSQDTIMIKADPDQSICMKTAATGTTKIISESGVELSTSGMNANVLMQATGTNSQVNIASTGNATLSAPVFQVNAETTNVRDLNVAGNLLVSGDKSTLQCRAVEIKDNMIDVNFGETGNGVTAKTAGLRVIRGEEDPFLMIFDETDDKFKVGVGSTNMKAVALAEEVATAKQEAITYADNAIGDLMGTAPEALNTLQELAEALGNDANFATTVATQIGTKADAEYVNAELAKKADATYVQNELEKKANVAHNHDDRYFTKDEINAMMANLVAFEPVDLAALAMHNSDEGETYVDSLLSQLEEEQRQRKELEDRLLKLEKAIAKIAKNK